MYVLVTKMAASMSTYEVVTSMENEHYASPHSDF